MCTGCGRTVEGMLRDAIALLDVQNDLEAADGFVVLRTDRRTGRQESYGPYGGADVAEGAARRMLAAAPSETSVRVARFHLRD